MKMIDGMHVCGRRLFAYTTSRRTEASLRIHAGVSSGSVLMSHGYKPCNHVARTNKLVHFACRVHCRRPSSTSCRLPKHKRGPEQLGVRFMVLIAKLYEVKSVARQAGWTRTR